MTPEEQLREACLRVTRPRVAALTKVSAHPHADVDTLTAQVRSRLGSVSTQTVHDVLRALADAELIRPDRARRLARSPRARVGDNHHHGGALLDRRRRAGSPDTWCDPRGFALKSCTSEGNFDLVGNNTNQGVEGLTGAEANRTAGEDADNHRRDLHEAIERNGFPSWTLSAQTMAYGDARDHRFNPFDLTKIWPAATTR
jgi:hypothetical protein